MKLTDQKSYIVYDGECPFCKRYVKLLRLQAAIGPVELINAREGHLVVDILKNNNIDLNEGMVFVSGGRISHGHQALQELSLLTTHSGVLNQAFAKIFSNPKASSFLYPILRAGRNLTLKLLGRNKIS